MNWCKECRSYSFDNEDHECPPKWYVNTYGDDLDDLECWTVVHAKTIEDAVQEGCRRDDAEHRNSVTNRGTTVVRVVPFDNPTAVPVRFRVEVELVAEYYTERIEECP